MVLKILLVWWKIVGMLDRGLGDEIVVNKDKKREIGLVNKWW